MYPPLQMGSRILRSECMTTRSVLCAGAVVGVVVSAKQDIAMIRSAVRRAWLMELLLCSIGVARGQGIMAILVCGEVAPFLGRLALGCPRIRLATGSDAPESGARSGHPISGPHVNQSAWGHLGASISMRRRHALPGHGVGDGVFQGVRLPPRSEEHTSELQSLRHL